MAYFYKGFRIARNKQGVYFVLKGKKISHMAATIQAAKQWVEDTEKIKDLLAAQAEMNRLLS